MKAKKMPRVFLSGPMVLYPDGVCRVQEAITLCKRFGFEPVLNAFTSYFLEPPQGICEKELAQIITRENRERIASSDLVVADCNEFRGGYQPYAGSSFELGYGYALGKKLYCYLRDTRSCAEKYGGKKKAYADGTPCDEEGRWFEPDCLNLMLWQPATIVGGTLEDALSRARADYFCGEERD